MSGSMEDFEASMNVDALRELTCDTSGLDHRSPVIEEENSDLDKIENVDNVPKDTDLNIMGPISSDMCSVEGSRLLQSNDFPTASSLSNSQEAQLLECCECGEKFSAKDVGVSKILLLCGVHHAKVMQCLPVGGDFPGITTKLSKQSYNNDDSGDSYHSEDDEATLCHVPAYDESIDGSLKDQIEVMEDHSKIFASEASEDYKETQRLFVIDKLYCGPLTGKDLGEVLYSIKKKTTRITIPVSIYQIQVYDSRFDEDDFVCRGSRSCYYKGIIEGVPNMPILFGYDSFTAYYCSSKKIGYLCFSAICPLRDPNIISGYVLVSLLRTRCNSPRLDAIIYSAFVRKCFRKHDFIKWMDGNFTNLSIRMPTDVHIDILRALEEFLDCGRWRYDPNRKHLHRDTRNPSVEAPKRHNMKETRDLNDHLDPLMIEDKMPSASTVNVKDVSGKPTLRAQQISLKTSVAIRTKSTNKVQTIASPCTPLLDTNSSAESTVDGTGSEIRPKIDFLSGGRPRRNIMPQSSESSSTECASNSNGNSAKSLAEFIPLVKHNKLVQALKQELKLESARALKALNTEITGMRNAHNAELRKVKKDYQAQLKVKDRQNMMLQGQISYLQESLTKKESERKAERENVPPANSGEKIAIGQGKGKSKNDKKKPPKRKEVNNSEASPSSNEGGKKCLNNDADPSPGSTLGEQERKKKSKYSHDAAVNKKHTEDLEELITKIICERTSTVKMENQSHLGEGRDHNDNSRISGAMYDDRVCRSYKHRDERLLTEGRDIHSQVASRSRSLEEYEERRPPLHYQRSRDWLEYRGSQRQPSSDAGLLNQLDVGNARGNIQYTNKDLENLLPYHRLRDYGVEGRRNDDNTADFIGVEQDGRRAGIFREYGVQARLDERGDVLVRQPRLYNPPSSRDGSSTARLESEYRNYYR